ncbi:hypothetical protein [Thauera aromatica]|uniref:Uncharacterized protein n=1 Tax=Thauera aromatica K172 TaxID=44139 RepID=A0A2R4BJ98_THAAR|nr:hypothetical protein [Thauera aromatica]AVR87381.1 hypothetical protein Tharo_0431 [Thauera aromatica K172]
MPSIPLPGTAADLRDRLARAIAFVERTRADSAAQLEHAQARGDSASVQFYAGRVQGFDFALAEMRNVLVIDEEVRT